MQLLTHTLGIRQGTNDRSFQVTRAFFRCFLCGVSAEAGQSPGAMSNISTQPEERPSLDTNSGLEKGDAKPPA